MKKRIFTGIVLFLLLVLTGCEKKNSSYEEVTWFSDISFWNPPQWSEKEGTITHKISEATGLRFQYDIPQKNAATKLSIYLVNHELPDIITVKEQQSISKLVGSGKVWNLEEFLKKYLPGSHLLKKFPQDIKEQLMIRDGGWYALPSHMKSPDNRKIYPSCSTYWDQVMDYGNPNAILWNEKLLRQAGFTLEDVTTRKEVLRILKSVSKKEMKVNGKNVIPCLVDGQGSFDGIYASTLQTLLNSFGAEYVDEDGNYYERLLQPQAKSALQFANTLFRRGYASSEQLKWENEQIKELIYEDRVLCFIGNMANIGFDALGDKAREWVSAGPILSDDGSLPILEETTYTGNYWLSTFISKDCKHPEKIAVWLDYMTSEEGMLECNYGVEGEDYELTEDELIQTTEKGREGREHLEETGMGVWFAFINTNWEYYQVAAPDRDTNVYYTEMLKCKFGMNEKTVRFDFDPISRMEDDCAGDRELTAWEEALEEFEKKQLLAVLLADSPRQFEQEYQRLADGMKERGIEKILERKNRYFKQNCEDLGTEIQKINR